MPEGLDASGEKNPEDVSDLWPEEYRKPTVNPRENSRREKYRKEQRQKLLDAVVEAQERYAKSNKPEDLRTIRTAKNRYINFIFLSEGADAAERAEQYFASDFGAIIKERRRRVAEYFPWLARNAKRFGYAALLAALTAGAVLAGVLTTPIGFVLAAGISYALLSDVQLVSLLPMFNKQRRRIKKFKKAEKESRKRGETYEQFQEKNLVLISEAVQAKRDIEVWSNRLSVFVPAALILVGGFVPTGEAGGSLYTVLQGFWGA